jgi:hypothetical protein
MLACTTGINPNMRGRLVGPITMFAKCISLPHRHAGNAVQPGSSNRSKSLVIGYASTLPSRSAARFSCRQCTRWAIRVRCLARRTSKGKFQRRGMAPTVRHAGVKVMRISRTMFRDAPMTAARPVIVPASSCGNPADAGTPILNRLPRRLRAPLEAVYDAVHVDLPIKNARAAAAAPA